MLQAALILLLTALALLIARAALKRDGSRQLNRLSVLLEKTKNIPEDSGRDVKKLQNKIYALIYKEMDSEEHKVLYQSIDLLKLYLGEGLGQPDDPARITRIISQAMRKDQTDVLGYSIHAFCPLIRKAPPERIAQAIEQLCIVAAVAMKKRKNFLTARAIEIILEGLERMERAWVKGQLPAGIKESALETGTKAVKLVGLAILRGADVALFREFCVKINEFITSPPIPAGGKERFFARMWPAIFAAWLNYLARRENEEAFSILMGHIKALSKPIPGWGTVPERENDNFDLKALGILISECRHMVIVSSMNPYNTFAAPMLSFFLNIAFKLRDTGLWRQAASCAQEVSQTALTRHDTKEAFPMVYPFLEIGRRMLMETLKNAPDDSGVPSERNLFVRNALITLAREWMKTAEYESRKSFIMTVPEIVLQIREQWLDYPAAEGSEKYLNKFCHFLIVYWMRQRPKLAARIPQIAQMQLRGLLTEEELKKLELFPAFSSDLYSNRHLEIRTQKLINSLFLSCYYHESNLH